MNIETLKNQSKRESLMDLRKTSKFLQKYYFEEKLSCKNRTFKEVFDCLSNLHSPWVCDIWGERNLYYWLILNEDDIILFSGENYDDLIDKKHGNFDIKVEGNLYLIGFKFQDSEPIKTDTERIGKLESDISEIKEVLKKMIV